MRLWEIFRGYDGAHGRFEVRRKSDSGKAEGKALTIKGAPAAKQWTDHLSGSGPGLGIIPLLGNDSVVWGCIDIDVIGIDHAALERSIAELELPLVVARSKSGGAHCFLFLNEEVEAHDVREALENWAAALGHGGCEVFPKQTSRYNDQDLGNWLNMPYYNVERTVRYGIRDGEPLGLTEFEQYAEEMMVNGDTVRQIRVISKLRQQPAPGGKRRTSVPDADLPENAGEFEEGPPCLQIIEARGGFPDGTRNDGMYNVAVYLRKRFPDDWQDRLSKYNDHMCDPPLSLQEINQLAKSVNKKDYAYRCSQQPICDFCNRRACQSRKFGIGEMVEGLGRPDINQLTKHAGDPVIWFAEVAGERLMLTTDELLNQNAFKRKVAEAINRVMTSVPQPRWDKYVDSKMRDCDVVEVPEDATPTGQFKLLVEQYVTGRAQATSRDELATRFTPYDDGKGTVMFRSRGLLEYLDNHSFRYRSEHHVWQMLRDMGADSRFLNIKGRGVNVWALPKPGGDEDEDEPPEFGETPF